MKILDLCEFYSERGGGVGSYLNRLISAGNERGHEVIVVAPGPRTETITVGQARVIRYRAPAMPYDNTYHWPYRIDRMRAIVKAEKPDVLQLSSPFIPAAAAATLKAKVRAYVYHSDPIGCYAEYRLKQSLWGPVSDWALAAAWAWMRAVCHWGDVTVVAGPWLQRQLAEKGCRNAVTVPFGIDHEHFSPTLRDTSLRRELMGKLADVEGAKLLLITGRLAMDKRQALLIQAALRVAREIPIALVVVGDGPERARLEKLASDLPVSTFMPFTHDRKQYASILASVDALLHGSRCETYGFVIVETLASGTPVLVPDAGAAGALASAECAALYRPCAGPDEVAEALRTLLRRPRAALNDAACKAAALQPSMTSHFERLFELYQSLLDGEQPPTARATETSTPL